MKNNPTFCMFKVRPTRSKFYSIAYKGWNWPKRFVPQKSRNKMLSSHGTNSSMFANCSVFCVVRHVQSSVLGQNVMFGSVRSSVRLLCDQTILGTYSLMFTNCSVFCDVRHVRSSILGQNVMFGMFDVRTFNVQSVHSSVFWCSFHDYSKHKQLESWS